MRPAGSCRLALLAVLQSGAVGTFDTLARHAGVPELQAKYTLANLCRERVVRLYARADKHGVFPQRGRGLYAHTATLPTEPDNQPLDALRFAAQVWR